MSVANVLSEYLPSCLRMSLFLCISLLRVSWCTCQVPPICLGSHVSLCCQMSPNVLSKHHQSVWGSYTCLLLVLDWAQLILHLSRWAAVAGLQVLLPSTSNVLSKYLRFVWGKSLFVFTAKCHLLYCQVLLACLVKLLFPSISWGLLPNFFQGVTSVCQTC